MAGDIFENNFINEIIFSLFKLPPDCFQSRKISYVDKSSRYKLKIFAESLICKILFSSSFSPGSQKSHERGHRKSFFALRQSKFSEGCKNCSIFCLTLIKFKCHTVLLGVIVQSFSMQIRILRSHIRGLHQQKHPCCTDF